jgi:hypothetical protein
MRSKNPRVLSGESGGFVIPGVSGSSPIAAVKGECNSDMSFIRLFVSELTLLK